MKLWYSSVRRGCGTGQRTCRAGREAVGQESFGKAVTKSVIGEIVKEIGEVYSSCRVCGK